MTRFLVLILTAAALSVCASVVDAATSLPRLKVSDNKRFLVTEDGKPFFWLGDTAWELIHRLNKEETIEYLDNRQKLGFTVVQTVVFSELDGRDKPSADGFLPFGPNSKAPIPVEEQGEYDDYWDRVDFVVEEANKRGIYVALLPTWGTYWHDEPFFNPDNAAQYGEWLGKRYKDAGVIWVLGGDRHFESAEEYKTLEEMGRGLRLGDGGKHLVTFHPTAVRGSADYWPDSDFLDFTMRQNGHFLEFRYYEGTIADYNRTPIKPVIDGESIYEEITIAFKPNEFGYSAAYDVRRPLYWDLFNGAFGHTYGCNAVWQMCDRDDPNKSEALEALRSWRESLNLPGATQMQYARYLIESRPFLTRIPDMALLVEDRVKLSVPGSGTRRFAATRDQDGTYAFVYYPVGRAATIDTSRLSGKKLRACWYDPRTGNAQIVGEFDNVGRLRFEPPTPGEAIDWVLVLDDVAKNYPLPGRNGSKDEGQSRK